MAIDLPINMIDGVSGPAGSAAVQVDILKKQMNALSTAMLKAKASGDSGAFWKSAGKFKNTSDEVKRLGGGLNSAQKDFIKLQDAEKKRAGSLSKTTDATKAAKVETSGLGAAMGGLAGPIAAAVAFYGGLAIAFHKATSSAYDFAAAHGLVRAQFDALGRGTSGKAILNVIGELSTRLPYTTDKMQEWAKSLTQAGVTDIPRLKEAIKAVAASEAMVGGGGAMSKLVTDIQEAARTNTGLSNVTGRFAAMGVTIADVSKELGITSKYARGTEFMMDNMGAMGRSSMVKLGNAVQAATIKKGIPAMRAMGATWETVSAKFKDNMKMLFTGIADTEGFKAFSLGLQRIVAMFGHGTTQGKNMKSGLTGLFDSIFMAGAKAIEWFQLTLINSQISLLDFAIACAPVIKQVKMLIASFDDWGVVTTALTGMKVVVVALAIAVAPLLVLFAIIPVALIAIGTAIIFVVGAIAKLIGKIPEAIESLTALKTGMQTQASNATGGFTDKLLEGGKVAITTVAKTFSGVVGAAAIALDSHSPSKKFQKLGQSVPDGFATGIEDRGNKATLAAADMASDAVGGAATPLSNGGAKGSGGGNTFHIAEGAIQISGAGSPEETKALLDDSWIAFIERCNAIQGRA